MQSNNKNFITGADNYAVPPLLSLCCQIYKIAILVAEPECPWEGTWRSHKSAQRKHFISLIQHQHLQGLGSNCTTLDHIKNMAWSTNTNHRPQFAAFMQTRCTWKIMAAFCRRREKRKSKCTRKHKPDEYEQNATTCDSIVVTKQSGVW